jgi:hypothetical protein
MRSESPSRWLSDWRGECEYVIAALALLNSKNVVEMGLTDFAQKNNRRVKDGKPPLFDHYTIGIPGRYKMRHVSDGASGRELRAHCGHFKVRRTGVFFWAALTELELLVGQVTAAAVGALAAAVREWHCDGGACPDTKAAAGDGIAELVMLKQAVAGEIADFEATARTHALALLRQRCGAVASEELLVGLIDDVLRIVARVCATQWH